MSNRGYSLVGETDEFTELQVVCLTYNGCVRGSKSCNIDAIQEPTIGRIKSAIGDLNSDSEKKERTELSQPEVIALTDYV